MKISPWKNTEDIQDAEIIGMTPNDPKLETDPRRSIAWGMSLVLFGFGGFIIWAMLAPLDQGVVTQGTVNVDSNRKTVQHLRGGIVEGILVRDGDKTTKDAPLLRLDDTQLVKTKQMLQEQINGLEQLVNAKTQQIASLNDELQILRKLFAEGYVPRNRLFDLERALADLTGARGDAMANIAANKERLAATQDDIARSIIRSPSDGVVMGLAVHTVGGVITPGEKLMDIVPENEPLIINIQVPTHLIDKVHAGLLVDVRFSALNQHVTPIVDGEVVTVSADSFTDQRTGAAFYTAQVNITQEGMAKLKNQRIQPGMPVDVTVKTGERTMMDYLIKPLTDRMANSMKEE